MLSGIFHQWIIRPDKSTAGVARFGDWPLNDSKQDLQRVHLKKAWFRAVRSVARIHSVRMRARLAIFCSTLDNMQHTSVCDEVHQIGLPGLSTVLDNVEAISDERLLNEGEQEAALA